jgi:hypothetical protein
MVPPLIAGAMLLQGSLVRFVKTQMIRRSITFLLGQVPEEVRTDKDHSSVGMMTARHRREHRMSLQFSAADNSRYKNKEASGIGSLVPTQWETEMPSSTLLIDDFER